MRALVPIAAILVCGLALYCTNSVLDQVFVNGTAPRVALVPSWQVLLAFVAMAALGVAWLARRSAPRTVTSAPMRLRVGALTLPVFALVLLIVPFLPVLPDWVPALQLTGGPLKWVVWLTVTALSIWTLWQARIVRADWLQRWSLPQATLLIGVLTAAASGIAASQLAGTVIFPSGDEPHYLVMAQSLWRDGDLKIENNHARGDYREYFTHDLKPDFLERGVDGEIYSIHPIGMPVLMAPVYAAGGYYGVVAALVLCAAFAAAVMWRSVVNTTGSPGAATFAWAAVALTSPFLYNTFTVYPEIVAAVAVVVGFTRAADTAAWPRGIRRWLIVGLCCGVLPWLSTKYAPMSAVLLIVGLGRIVVAGERERIAAAVAIVLPYVISLAGWFLFFYRVWGTPNPSAPYGDLGQTSLRNVVFGSPGLLFDQEYGVLAYAPVYVIAITGLVIMWRSAEDSRRRAVEIVAVFAALLGTVGAFRVWWGGTASPGRPVASALLLFALPIAVAVRAAPQASARRAGQQVLLWVSVGIAATLMLAQQGLLINNARDGTSTMLEYWSPRWNAWSMAPTFIFHEAPVALLHSLVWLAIAFLAAFLLSRWRTRTAGGATLAAVTTFVGALLLVTSVMPLLPNDPPLPEARLEARAQLPILEHYDTAARPAAAIYDPFRLERAPAIVTAAMLTVAPGVRADPQPIRVLHNGRFSLPPGRYHVDIEWAGDMPRTVPVGLQVGRIEPVWQSWPVQPQRGVHWGADFELPTEANFVAFRGSTELERAIARITIIPVAVVDEGVRPHVPTVLATRQYGNVTALFHDVYVSPEPAGFWVLGARGSRVTFARKDDEAPLVLRVHSGLEPNRVRISMRGWDKAVDLQAEKPVEITVPDSHRRIVTVDVHPERGFSPRTYDPASSDPRYLGAWVEVVK